MPKDKLMGFYVVQVVHSATSHEIMEVAWQWGEIAKFYDLAFNEHVRIEVETYSFTSGEYCRIVVSQQLLNAAKIQPGMCQRFPNYE